MNSIGPLPDWARLFPATPHRWQMGLRPAEARRFFAPEPQAAALRAERARWLAADEEAYSALHADAGEAVEECAQLAAEWSGFSVCAATAPAQLLELGRWWEPDFVLLQRGDDDVFRLTAGVVCFASGWALREKLGAPMEEIHGPVPGLNAALARQIHTFLDRLTPGAAWARENWGLSADGELNHHPARARPRLDERVSAEEVWLRVERQLLCKLPRTSAVLFGIRVDVHPFARILAEPSARAGLEIALKTMSPEAASYKGLGTARERLLDLLAGREP